MDKPTLTPHVNLSLTREACGITQEALNLRVLEYSENIKARVVVVLMKRKQMINEVNHRMNYKLDLPLNARVVKPEVRKSQFARYSGTLFPDPMVRDGINFTINKDDCHLIGTQEVTRD